tara:strand:- start:19 stop:252 length:234 start_codon:yes stop_codon:yes gene_type:complete
VTPSSPSWGFAGCHSVNFLKKDKMDQEQLKKYNELEKLIDKAMAHSRWPDERLEDMVEKYMGKMARLENGERPHEIN